MQHNYVDWNSKLEKRAKASKPKKKPQKQKTKQAKKLFSHGLQPFISLVKEARLMFPCTLPRQFFKIFFFLNERTASYIFVNKLECIYTFYFNTISNKFEKQENCPRFIIFTLPQISITYIFLFFFYPFDFFLVGNHSGDKI